MPISLRLPPHVEEQIAEYAVRQGITKTAVIMRSLEDYLATHAKPSAFQLYEDVMRQDGAAAPETSAEEAARPRKLALREALKRKHAERSARATRALKTRRTPRKAD